MNDDEASRASKVRWHDSKCLAGFAALDVVYSCVSAIPSSDPARRLKMRRVQEQGSWSKSVARWGGFLWKEPIYLEMITWNQGSVLTLTKCTTLVTPTPTASVRYLFAIATFHCPYLFVITKVTRAEPSLEDWCTGMPNAADVFDQMKHLQSKGIRHENTADIRMVTQRDFFAVKRCVTVNLLQPWKL